jgi:hypothetical protein
VSSRTEYARLPHGCAQPASAARMVAVVESDRAGGSQPLREMEHAPTAIAVRQESMLGCVKEASSATSLAKTVITRVLGENRRVSKLREEPRCGLTGEPGAIALAITAALCPKVGSLFAD